MSSPTEDHNYAMISESNKLEMSEKEQLKQMKLDSNHYCGATKLSTVMEDHDYVISVSIIE